VATRDAGKTVMQAFKDAVPTMIGGAADLVESTKTEFTGGGLFSADWVGRNIAFGIREHAMGSIVNGIAAHGGCVKPYGSTFLIFSDYMRPAVRLSALMGLPVVWAWTHDSVGLGEDGPTHQPIEHLMSLRAMPLLRVFRPGDAAEAAEGWRWAMTHRDGPVALVMTRQKLPVIDRSRFASASGVARGAYVLADAEGGAPQAIIIATGSEVALAVAARELLAKEGVRTRVVSMPCWESFEAQSAEYRESVLPASVKARVSVEAGVTFGWHRWVGDAGVAIGIDHFGASAPGETNMEKFGFTADNVARTVRSLVK